jgi:hypothetical protein
MKFDNIDKSDQYEYEQECSCCGLKKQVLTQRDDHPEYYTYVYLRCQCGEYIQFELPVN